MGVKVGASEVGVYLGAEKLAGVGGSEVSNIKTAFDITQGNETIEFTVYNVTTQRNFLLTTHSISGDGGGATIQVMHNSAWETIGTISGEEILQPSGFTYKGTFPKDSNQDSNVQFKLVPIGTTNFNGYSMVVYD